MFNSNVDGNEKSARGVWKSSNITQRLRIKHNTIHLFASLPLKYTKIYQNLANVLASYPQLETFLWWSHTKNCAFLQLRIRKQKIWCLCTWPLQNFLAELEIILSQKMQGEKILRVAYSPYTQNIVYALGDLVLKKLSRKPGFFASQFLEEAQFPDFETTLDPVKIILRCAIQARLFIKNSCLPIC